MKKIRLGDTEVVAGLEWSAIRSPSSSGAASISEKKALASFLSSNKGSPRGVVISTSDYTVVGRPEKKEKLKTKAPSAAALFALANGKELPASSGGTETEGTGEDSNWIIVEQINGPVEGYEGVSEPLFWLGMARNGLPVPGADLIVNRQQALDELSEMLSASSGTTVFTVDRDIRFHVIGQVNVVNKRFEDIIRDAGVDHSKAQIKLFSLAAPIAIGVVALTVLALGGYFGWEAWSSAREAEIAAAKARRNAEEQARRVSEETRKYEAEVKKALQDGLRAGMTEVTNALASASPYDMLEAWREIIYGVNLYQSTWNLTGISCTIEAEEPVCTVALTRGDLGTNRILLEEHPDAIIEGDNATYVLRGKAVPTRNIELPYLVSSSAFSRGLISDLQMLRMTGLSHTADASKEVTKSVNLPEPSPLVPLPSVPMGPADLGKSAPAAPTSVNIQLGIAKGEIKITGNQFYQISGVGRYLDLPNTRATSLDISLGGGAGGAQDQIRWTLTLDYMVRTLPSPIVPAVPLGEGQITIEIPEEYKSKVPVDGGMEETSGTATGPVEVPSEVGQGQFPAEQPASLPGF